MTHAEIALLLEQIDRAYDRHSWHGPNLKGSIRGLDSAQAGWRPGPGRRSIAEITLHAAYWKYAARRRLRGDKRGSFAMPGSNWFALPDELDARRWREVVRLLNEEHQRLRETISAFGDGTAPPAPARGKTTPTELILGIAAHDVYHAGQIQLLKKLWADRVARRS